MSESLPVLSENLDALTVEILILKRQTAANIIEIGRRLLQAKEMVGHGNWGKYLQDQVQFSHPTANRFMKAAQELSNSSPVMNLEPSKVYLLLEAPEEERETLAKQAPDLTKRELEAKVRELNEAKRREDEIKRELADMGRRLERALREAEEAKNKAPKVIEKPGPTRTVFQDNPETKAQVERLARELAEKKQALQQREADLAKLRKWYEETQKDLQRLKEQVDKDYTLEARIREKEERAKELDGLIRQMEANFEDGSRNRRGGAELQRTLYPLERILWSIAQDVSDLRKEGVGGPMDDDAVAKIRTKLRELANDLDAILKDRKTITLTAEVEVLNRE